MHYSVLSGSSQSGGPTTQWSGRVCGESWAVWLAPLPSLSERRVATHLNPLSRYVGDFNALREFGYLCIHIESKEFRILCSDPINIPHSQHSMVIDTRNSPILPRKGALLKINQVCIFYPCPLGRQPFIKRKPEAFCIFYIYTVFCKSLATQSL